MSKTNTWEYGLQDLIFNNDSPLFDVDNAGSSYVKSTADGSLFIALFTADPLEDESLVATKECNYTGYSRKDVPRDSTGWGHGASGTGIMTNAGHITFDPCTSGAEIATHFAICKAGTRAISDLLYIGALTGSLSISSGVTPQFVIGSLSVTEN